MDIYEKIHKHYNTLESFTADLDLTVFSNKTENRYFVNQKFSSPDKFFTRVTDEKGTFSVTTITNKDRTKTSADGSEYSLIIPSDEYVSLLFINNFFRAYYLCKETSISVESSLTKSDKTVLGVDISDSDLAIKSISLSIDNKTLSPHILTAYDVDGKKLLSAKFDNFKFNEKIDESIFNTD
ncbi:MAG: hypothetical protein IJB50_00930 [Clostridia bacterium]|nr:hypothetical protein [Clostridia bacterium]